MKFDSKKAGSRLSVGAVLALAAGAGVAHATPQDIETTSLAGNHRTWDLQNGDFGVNDGAITHNRSGSDAFDGGLILNVDGTGFSDSDGSGNYNASNQSITVGPESLSGLSVSRVEKAAGAYNRSLIRLNNPTGSAITATLEWYSNLGSDGSGVVQSSNSGDSTVWTTSDRWMVTSEPGANGDDDDPTVAFVLFGKDAATRPSNISLQPDSGETAIEYEVTVPAGGTRYLLFYTEMWDTPEHAKASMTKYNYRRLSPSLLSGISTKVRGKIINWSL